MANDVTEALGYTNSREALKKHIDEEDKAAVTIRDGRSQNGQRRKINTINESGMYSLILSSKKAEVKKFKRWVTSEVLPQIREKGTYTHSTLTKNLPTQDKLTPVDTVTNNPLIRLLVA